MSFKVKGSPAAGETHAKKGVSAAAESQKTEKTELRQLPKRKKMSRQHFGSCRSSFLNKIQSAAPAE
ncbi:MULTISPECIES: hypothetical protein [Prevotellaceae]|uniref:Uncharacterized protein n=1 Tax=Hallella seregens ATCC 51272 TaxID=1336250 RepID=A0ABV5ZHG6_9BACT|nr:MULTISPECIES: hypothetical protein [Prevotellaceae]